MKSTHTASLPIPSLSPAANQVHMFPQLQTSNLLSLGQLCDDDCRGTFDKHSLNIYNKNNNLIIQAPRDQRTGMWMVNLQNLRNLPSPQSTNPTPTINISNGIIRKETAINDLIQFFHASMLSCKKSTWRKAIQNNFFTTWPGLTDKAVKNCLLETEATDQGHQDQEQKGIQSTKQRTNEVMCALMPAINSTGRTFSDQTGKFPITSYKGNNYVFILYDYDSNSIHSRAIPDRSSKSILSAFTNVIDLLISKGFHPKIHLLDNEASKELKKAIVDRKINFQLAPPHIHRQNSAERAIRTFKNHFVAGLATCDPKFPLQCWDLLLPQAEITLNLLRASNINPKLSAYAILHGQFDYNKTPLAPPGTKAQIHVKAEKRESWGTHSIDAWYIGPALEHYRCYQFFNPKTNKIIIRDTVTFHPTRIRMPIADVAEKILHTAKELTTTLQQATPENSPFLEFGNEKLNALKKLAHIFESSFKTNTITQSPSLAPYPNPLTPTTSVPRVEIENNNSPSVPRVGKPLSQPTLSPKPHSFNIPYPKQNPFIQSFVHKHQHQYNNEDFIPLSQLRYTGFRNQVQRQLRNHHQINNLFKINMSNPVIDTTTGESMEIRSLLTHPNQQIQAIWKQATCNELGRLAQGYKNDAKGTDCCDYIYHHEIPSNKRPTYARIVSEIRPQKKDPYRVRITVGGNLIDYPHDVSAPTADISTVKLHLNSTISDPTAKYMCIDIKNMYLMSEMEDCEYMYIPLELIPDNFMNEYNLWDKVHNNRVYLRIKKGMYGLPQAGKLAHDKLKKVLEPHGYYPCRLTPGLWKHKTNSITFTLVVDDFGVKYSSQKDIDHLLNVLQAEYELHLDWKGSFMLGMKLDWCYKTNKRHVDISMPDYINAALTKFQHPKPPSPQHQPYPHTPPTYGARVQYTPPADTSPILSTADKTRIQQIVGVFLYYARAVDPTMLPALNELGSQQANPTARTAQLIAQFLDYAATHQDAVIRYTPSDMILHVHSDASYLSVINSRSRAAGHFFLSSAFDPKTSLTPPSNGPCLTLVKVLRNVMASATEAEMGGLFLNCQEAIPLRNALIEMGHPQPPTPVQTDNSTAHGIVTSSIRQRRSKAMDMRFHWVQDRVNQGHFIIYWRPGRLNLADYFSKHHPPSHHTEMRPKYLHMHNNLSPSHSSFTSGQGCVSPGFHFRIPFCAYVRRLLIT